VVAFRAGVSIATVSRFLNSPDKANAKTARRNSASTDQLSIVQGLSGMTVAMDVRVVERDTTWTAAASPWAPDHPPVRKASFPPR
jgi:hypothetical protein